MNDNYFFTHEYIQYSIKNLAKHVKDSIIFVLKVKFLRSIFSRQCVAFTIYISIKSISSDKVFRSDDQNNKDQQSASKLHKPSHGPYKQCV